jgi:hypothetical protein
MSTKEMEMKKIIISFLFLLLCGSAMAAVDPERMCDAIYIAEGGLKTKYPYGILKKYKTTTPRQACINTVNHALRDWDGARDFIVFLGSRYCPIGAKNDPHGLNKNWVKNVRFYYERSAK